MSVERRHAGFREAVLDAAEAEFARVGYGPAKVAAIAASADVSLATVYKLFGGKEDIWDQLHAARMAVLLDDVRGGAGPGPSPLDRLLAGIAAVARFLATHDRYLELSLAESGGWLAPAGGTGVQRSVWSAGLDMIGQGVAAAIEAGEVTGLRPRTASCLVVSVLQVWLAEWVESGRDRPVPELVDDLVSHLRSFLTTGSELRATVEA